MPQLTVEESLNAIRPDWDLVSSGAMSRAPLYYQLYTVLRGAIYDGKLAYKSQIPSEQRLADAFEISRITAKRAMDELAAEGLIARFRGKGSHVTYQYSPQPVRAPLVGMLENMAEMGKHSSVRVLSVERLAPPKSIRELLGVPVDELVHKLVRVRSNEEGEPFAYYVSWTAGVRRGYTRSRLENTLRLEILRDNNLKLTHVSQELGAEPATPSVAAQLDVEPGTALLSVRRLSSVDGPRIVDVLDCLYNPKRYKYAMELSLD